MRGCEYFTESYPFASDKKHIVHQLNNYKMSNPKRHHYLPEFYLNYFTDVNNKFWVYHRDRKKYVLQTPVNTTVEGYRYTLFKENGEKDNRIEEFLSQIETDTKPLLEKLNNGEIISDNEKGKLATFIALQKTRVPETEKTYYELSEKLTKLYVSYDYYSEEKAKSILEELEKETGEKFNVNPKEFYDFIQKKKYSLAYPKEEYLITMLKEAEEIRNHLSNMKWRFLFAQQTNSNYITTDNPFITYPPKNHNKLLGVGILTPGASNLIPLTSKVLLMMFDKGDNISKMEITEEHVSKLNYNIVSYFDNFIISKNKIQLENIVDTLKIYEWERGERVYTSK